MMPSIDEFVIHGFLGEGTYGRVYHATRPATKEQFALKLLNPELQSDETELQRFQNEYEVQASLEHENIV